MKVVAALSSVTLLCLSPNARADEADDSSSPPVTWAPPAALREGPQVTVRLAAPTDTALEVMTQGEWKRACDAPCVRSLPLYGTYRVTGDLLPSREFALPATPPGGLAEIEIRPASPLKRQTGKAFVIMGSFAATGGAIAMYYSALAASQQSLPCLFGGTTACADSQDGSKALVIGGVVATAGIAAIVSGVILMATNKETGVTPRAVPR